MTIERNIDTLFSEELDAIAAEKNYVAEAERMLEAEFISVAPAPTLGVKHALFASGAAAAVIAAFIAYALFFPGELTATLRGSSRPIATGSWVSSMDTIGMALDFSDGSEILLEENTEIRVQALRTEGAHVALERGNINVSVVHETLTRWDLDAGPFRILITGTRFKVNWLPEEKVFVVDMEEGSVAVNGPMLDGGKRLGVGERLQVSLNERVVEITKEDRVERIVAKNAAQPDTEFQPGYPLVGGEAPADTLTDTPDRRSVRHDTRAHRAHRERSVSWRSLAKKGQYGDAITAANQFGISRIAATRSSPELMLLADAARFSNNTALALDIYKVVRKRFPNTAESQRAAFTLGRIKLEQQHNPLQAARWFEACYRDNQKGTMAREASGRLIEALDRAGENERAKVAAQQYINLYPRGPHSKLAKKILSISDD